MSNEVKTLQKKKFVATWRHSPALVKRLEVEANSKEEARKALIEANAKRASEIDDKHPTRRAWNDFASREYQGGDLQIVEAV